MAFDVNDLLVTTVTLSGPIALACLCVMWSELSGVYVFGTEAVMLVGALTGFLGAYVTGNLVIGVVIGLAGGILMGLLTAFYEVTLNADQIIFAIALLVIGPSLTDYLFSAFAATPARALAISTNTFPAIPIPYLSSIPYLGAFFDQSWFIYASYILVILSQWFLYRTKWGLRIRAVGMNPRAADSMGSNVYLVRYLCIIVGSAMAALGGIALILAGTGYWVDNVTAGRGLIGVALVRVGNWRVYLTYATALVVSGLLAASTDLTQVYSSTAGTSFPYEIFSAFPYIFAVAVIAISYKWTRSNQPNSLGLPYKRE